MKILRDDLAEALEELEEGQKEEAHAIIEQHLTRANKMKRAVEELETVLEKHIDALDDLAHRTEDVDLASIRESLDELRDTMEEDEEIRQSVKKIEEIISG